MALALKRNFRSLERATPETAGTRDFMPMLLFHRINTGPTRKSCTCAYSEISPLLAWREVSTGVPSVIIIIIIMIIIMIIIDLLGRAPEGVLGCT
jgi:hypothetical protein